MTRYQARTYPSNSHTAGCSPWKSFPARALLSGLGMMMAATITAPAARADVTNDPLPKQMHSIYGAYLAAGQAETENDFLRAADLLDQILSNDPDDPLLQRRGMLANLHAGHIDRAIELARPQIVVYPSEVDIAALTLAVGAMMREDWDRVLKVLNPARRIAMARYSTPILAAWAEFGKGDADAAILMLDGLNEDPQAKAIHDLHASMIFLAANRPAEAEALLSPTADNLEAAPNAIIRALARAKQMQGNIQGASDLLKGYQALHPDNDLVANDIAQMDEGKTLSPIMATPQQGAAEALIDLSSQIQRQVPLVALRYARLGVYLDPENEFGRMVVAVLLQGLKQDDAAISVLNEIPEGSRYSWDAKMRIADSMIQLKQDDAAIDWLENLAKARPDDLTALNKLGLIMRIQGEFEDAKEYYKRALERVKTVTPDDWTLYYFLGITEERTDNWPAAEKALKQALELYPDHPAVLNYLGYSWIDQGINVEEGLDMIERAVAQRANDGNIVDSLGWAYYRLGDYEEAVIHLERAVQLLPSEAVINDHLGDAYWKVGRYFEARYQWGHALTLDPEEDLRATVEEKLEKGLDAVDSASSK
ncbi:tetratricopeptide repeat protein [Hwanghaeella sp. 1Z406]|uniref:tetratricopeptide repeat protein n=1 Tax=Hwanghaeella sp. 1Z406 TaxID=3402811 RepID=UPI003B66B851|tara:strand:+ start:43096 stop:44877 length:1782 start_codon:yes stop_codon:yes gene_type:complete